MKNENSCESKKCIFATSSKTIQMRTIIVIIILAALSAVQCKTSKTVLISQEERAVINTNSFAGEEAIPDFKVVSASISGNILNLKVEFTGEKGKHEFDLLWNGSIMKSLPPKVSLTPVHKAVDSCGKKTVTMDLSFNLGIISEKLAGYDTVIIMIAGYSQSLEFTSGK